MDDFHDLAQPGVWMPIVASIVTGAIIGFEREWQAKAAGLRTHTLVCFSSAALMMAAAQQSAWTFHPVPGASIVSDPTRMAHGILTGIGFLCAGVIFRQGSATHGLTTAASLWMTAALGTLYGAGLFWLGVVGSLATLIVLIIFRIVQLVLPDWIEVTLHLSVSRPGDRTRDDIRAALLRHSRSVPPPAWRLSRDDTGDGTGPAQVLHLAANLWLRGARECDALVQDLRNIPGAVEISVSPVPMAHRDPWR